MTSPERLAALIILAGAASVFALRPAARLYENGAGDVPRYAQMAYEMRHAGTLVPRLNGAPYHEAMPISAQVPYAIAALQGEVTPLTSRVLPAFCALLMVATAMALARRHGSTRIGLLTGGIIVLSHLAYTYARSARVEAPLGFAVAAAIGAFFHGSRVDGPRRFLWYALAGLATAFAICLKGPAAVVIALALAPVLVVERRWRALIEGGAVALAVAAAATAAWLAPYISYLGPEEAHRFYDQIWGHETMDKVKTGYGEAYPPWFYLLEVWPNFLPWIVPALIGAWRLARRPREASALELLAIGWIALPFLMFSAAAGKHIRYFVPLVPAFAILAAFEIDRWLEAPKSRGAWSARWVAIAVGAAIVAAGLGQNVAVEFFTKSESYGARELAELGSCEAFGWLTGLAGAAAGLLAAVEARRWRLDRALLALFVAVAVGLSFFFSAILPLPDIQRHSSAHLRLAEKVAPLVRPEDPLAVLNPPTAPGGEILEASLLGLYLEHLQRAPCWVEIARPEAPPRASLLLAREHVGARPVIAVIPWARHKSEPEERWLLLGPEP